MLFAGDLAFHYVTPLAFQGHVGNWIKAVTRLLRFDAGMPAEAAARDIRLGVYASWREAERILPNVLRCYQEFRNELDRPLDLSAVLDGMERLRGARAPHTCL